MIKPAIKTLSFVFAAFGAVSVSAAGQGPMLHLAASPVVPSAACAAQAETERGWEAQQRLLDERLAAKGVGVEIPGTIISPPLPDFVAGPAAASRNGKPATGEATASMAQTAGSAREGRP